MDPGIQNTGTGTGTLTAGTGEDMYRAAIAKRRRTRQLHRRYLAAGFIAAVLLTIFSHSAAIPSSASEQGQEACFKYYQSVEVAFGESFDSVAEAHYDAQRCGSFAEFRGELLAINNLTMAGGEVYPSIRPGDSLIVPYYDSDLR